MDSIGIDVHKNNSQVCILTEHGELIERNTHNVFACGYAADSGWARQLAARHGG